MEKFNDIVKETKVLPSVCNGFVREDGVQTCVEVNLEELVSRLSESHENEVGELKQKNAMLESERDNWRKHALEEDAVANEGNNASRFGSYKEMVDYWSSHYEEIKKPLMAWAFERKGDV